MREIGLCIISSDYNNCKQNDNVAFCSLKYSGLTVLVILLALMNQVTGRHPSFSAGFTTRVQSRILL